MSLRYRNDIGTLRALAVLSVVLYHFKAPFLPGGFAGVDVFFVLSGFLMADIYFEKISQGFNGCLSFYASRIRRLYPALISFCFIGAIFVYATTPAYMLNDFLKEARYALTFTSNIFYQNNSSYFDAPSEKRWLLHTWSLSVEWQFYILFPIVIYCSNAIFGKKRIHVGYAILFVSSLLLCLYFSHVIHKPTFYTLSTRAWELLAGALASKIIIKVPKLLNILLSALGIGIVVSSFMLIDVNSSWPDSLTLTPVLGSVLCIIACNGGRDFFLRNALLRFVADISYSLYLWHWLIIAYMVNLSIGFTTGNKFLGIAISFILAIASRYILEDFRSGWGKKVAISLAVFMTASYFVSHSISSALAGISKYSEYGKSKELAEQFHSGCFIQGSDFDIEAYKNSGCLNKETGKKTVLLIGDSHAAELSMAFREQLKGYNVIQATASGCFPYPDDSPSTACGSLMRYIYRDYLKNNKVDYIFLTGYWISYGPETMNAYLKKAISDLSSHASAVYVIGEMKSFHEPFFQIALRDRKENLCNYQRSDSKSFNGQLREDVNSFGGVYLDVFDFEGGKGCNLIRGDEPLYFDTNHLTPLGARMVVEKVMRDAGI